ncbi:hypothetical protein VPNG_03770 [Cytospora leucostoma]|uniref:Uncharacterized protein n=1 Tax=Cytospora leucostoma TaxID=1230097 RepID=A0A423XFG2_9PEZI|nr:hypothetical protein VPNG_03770 [Cytospora leucostoma]
MAFPDVVPPDTTPGVATAQVLLEDGEGGLMVSRTRVLGGLDPLRLAETSGGMIAEGNEVMVLVISACVRVAAVLAAAPFVVDMSMPDMVSGWAIVKEPARARRNRRRVMNAKVFQGLLDGWVESVLTSMPADARLAVSIVEQWLILRLRSVIAFSVFQIAALTLCEAEGSDKRT